MPKTAAATTTTMTALPTSTNAGPTTGLNLMTVTVDLIFDRVNFSPEGLRAALDAAYPTVSSDVDGAERPRGPFRFRISP